MLSALRLVLVGEFFIVKYFRLVINYDPKLLVDQASFKDWMRAYVLF
jgi:hypothetical protein